MSVTCFRLLAMTTLLHRSFHCAAVAVRALLQRFGDVLKESGLCQAQSMSTHCSGSGAAEIASFGVQHNVWYLFLARELASQFETQVISKNIYL